MVNFQRTAGTRGTGKQPGIQQGGPLLRSPLVLSDLTEHLLWPKLLRVAGLALDARRVMLCSLTLAVLVAIDRVGGVIVGSLTRSTSITENGLLNVPLARLGRTLSETWAGVRELSVERTAGSLAALFTTAPRDIALLSWWHVVAMLLGVVVLMLGATAAGRSAALAFAGNAATPWPRLVAFSIQRLRSTVGATLGMLAFIWILFTLVRLDVWALGVPGLNLLAIVLLPLALVFALLAVVSMITFVLGWPLLMGSMACEHGDALDAVQRTYAYVIARPGRLIGYSLIVAAQGILALFAALVVGTATNVLMVSADYDRSAGTLMQLSGWFQDFVAGLIGLACYGYALSVVVTGSTVLYLVMRRLVDGQDESELWVNSVAEEFNLQAPGAMPVQPSSPANSSGGA